MSFQFTLQKILEVRENEKIAAEKEYTEATRKFEEVATKLYELLKKKEDYENDYYKRLEKGIHVFQIQQSHQSLAQLERKIKEVQYYTQKARELMNNKQKNLIEKSIELKKYEKMKEIKYEQYLEQMKLEENLLMDEISIQQFVNR